MLLKSSSTPVLGSLLHSFSDGPNNSFDNSKPHSFSENHSKISFLHGGHSSFHSFTCISSPMSHSDGRISDFGRDFSTRPVGFRRARSDGNLEGLTSSIDDCHNSHPPRFLCNSSVLQTVPSFSVYKLKDEEEEEGEVGEGGGLESHVTIEGSILPMGGDFSFSSEKETVSVDVGETKESVFDKGIGAPPLFLARGLGIDVGGPSSAFTGGGGGGGGGNFFPIVDYDGGEEADLENYYKKMIEGNPCNPIFLRNYAQFLHQNKGDLERAEGYYERAILTGPGDGEILSQYAKLIWEHHHDQERAGSYFKQAVQAAPEDSYVLAAYANFLWEIEEEEEEIGMASPDACSWLAILLV